MNFTNVETFVILYKESPEKFYNRNLNVEATSDTEALANFHKDYPDAVFQAMYNKKIQLC